MSSSPAPIERHIRRGLLRMVWFAALWWVLTLGEPTSWIVGIPAVVAATWVSAGLFPEHPWRWQVRGAVWFIGYFGWQSIIGGFDVAWRALHPQLPLNPDFYAYRLRLPGGPAQTFFVNSVSLLPGTLSATAQADQLTVHVLNTSQPIANQLGRLEDRVASLFNVQLDSNASYRT